MTLFHNVMYASTQRDFDIAQNVVLNEEKKYPKFVKRFRDFLLRRKEWVLLDRRCLLTRGQNTNNFCEATIRILKDIILNRTKAYNLTALIEYCITGLENDLKLKLLDYSYERKKFSAVAVKAACVTLSKFSVADIKQIDKYVFLVPSAAEPLKHYAVDTAIGICTCMKGVTGGFCKHQCFLWKVLNIESQNLPMSTPHERYIMAKVALGEKCPPLSYFMNVGESAITIEETATSEINPGIEKVAPSAHSSEPEYTVHTASDPLRNELKSKLQELVPDTIPDYLAKLLLKSLSEYKYPNEKKNYSTHFPIC